jgi:hypothetical protein
MSFSVSHRGPTIYPMPDWGNLNRSLAAEAFAADPTSGINELDAVSTSLQYDGSLLFGALPDSWALTLLVSVRI